MIVAKKNESYYLTFPAIDSTTPASYKTGLSPVDTAYYKDGAGAWTSLSITDTATEIGSTGVYEIDLTAAELNHDRVIIKFSVSGMADDAYQFDLQTKLVDDLNDIAATDIVSGGAINTTSGAVDTVTTNTDMRGTDSAATASALATAQNDLDTITGADGVTLATTQALYAPNKTAPDNAGIAGIQADLDNATDGLGALKTLIDAIQVDVDSMGITKNAAFSNFEFPMVLTSDHYTAATSKTVTGERSIDGGAFASVSGTIAEVGSGVYQCDLLAADTNGDVITYKFSATDCDDTIITITTRA